MKKTAIVVDDHPISLSGLTSCMIRYGYDVINSYDHGIQAYNGILASKPNVVILDLNLPGMSGLEILEKVKANNKKIKIVLYTMYNDKVLYKKALELDVNGYLLKEFALEELEICLNKLENNERWISPKLEASLIFKNKEETDLNALKLSPSEQKILRLIAKEMSTKEIADNLFISPKTVENHRGNISKKLNLDKKNNSLQIWVLKNRGLFEG